MGVRRGPRRFVFFDPLVSIVSALAQYACYMFIQPIPRSGQADFFSEIEWVAILLVVGSLVGFFYGGALFIFEVIMHRRVRYSFVLVWIIAPSLIAGTLEGSNSLPEGLRLALLPAPLIIGFVISIVTARPVVLGRYLMDDSSLASG